MLPNRVKTGFNLQQTVTVEVSCIDQLPYHHLWRCIVVIFSHGAIKALLIAPLKTSIQYGLMSSFTQAQPLNSHTISGAERSGESRYITAASRLWSGVTAGLMCSGGHFSSGLTWAVRRSQRQGSPSNSLSL